MTHHFTVIFRKEGDGGYHVFCPTLPGGQTQSETIELHTESLTEDGLSVPEEESLIK
jgi:predicted RNase H-like HicB family nuclease